MRRVAFWLSVLTAFTIPWEAVVVFEGVGTIGRLLAVAAGGVWLVCVLISGRIRRPGLFHAFAAAFFLWNALSLFWSVDANLTLDRVLGYARMAALVALVWDLYRTREAVETALQAVVLGTVVPIASTIMNFLSGVQSDWGRYSATGDNSNTTATVIALALPIALYLTTRSAPDPWRRGLRWLNYAIVACGLFAIGLTATRFAAIMTLPTLFYAIQSRASARQSSIVVGAAIIAATLAAVVFLLPEESIGRLSTTAESVRSGDLTGRTVIWDHAFGTWYDHPVIGVGSGAFRKIVEPVFGRARSAHNSYLGVLAETGAVGLALLAILLAIAVEQAWRKSPEEAAFWLTLLLCFGIANLALTIIHTKMTWLLLSLNAAVVARERSPAPSSAPPRHHQLLRPVANEAPVSG